MCDLGQLEGLTEVSEAVAFLAYVEVGLGSPARDVVMAIEDDLCAEWRVQF